MRERQARIGARERRIELHGLREELPRAFVVGLVEAVHVPQAAVVRFPGVERVRRLEDGAIALDHFDFVRHRGDDAVADLVEHVERVV